MAFNVTLEQLSVPMDWPAAAYATAASHTKAHQKAALYDIHKTSIHTYITPGWAA